MTGISEAARFRGAAELGCPQGRGTNDDKGFPRSCRGTNRPGRSTPTRRRRNLWRQRRIPLCPPRHALRLSRTCLVFIVRRRSDGQHGAHRLDSVRVARIVDETNHDVPQRSSSAWAKYAHALRQISLARRSALTSRSNAFTRARSSVVPPVPPHRALGACSSASLITPFGCSYGSATLRPNGVMREALAAQRLRRAPDL